MSSHVSVSELFEFSLLVLFILARLLTQLLVGLLQAFVILLIGGLLAFFDLKVMVVFS